MFEIVSDWKMVYSENIQCSLSIIFVAVLVSLQNSVNFKGIYCRTAFKNGFCFREKQIASNVSQNTSLSGLSVFESVLNAQRTYLAFPL